MRQGQQNRRGRGRGGRKPQNPLARNYESNGPDVKIAAPRRISPRNTCRSRATLSPPATWLGESYLQHAEHYNRIIMAAQSQFSGQPNAKRARAPTAAAPIATRAGTRTTKAMRMMSTRGGGDIARRWRRRQSSPRRRWAGPRAPCRRPRASCRRTRPAPPGGNGREPPARTTARIRPKRSQPDDTATRSGG